jgi:hypothetical protein
MIREHDALEAGLFGHGCDLEELVRVFEGDGLPELHRR